MTAGELIAKSILRWKDENENSVTNAEAMDYLNRGVHSVFMLLVREQSEIAITDVPVALSADTGEYALSTHLPDFQAMARDGVYFDGVSDPLFPAPYSDKVRNAGATDTPASFYVTSTNIGFIPVPNAGATVNCRYFKAVSELSLTDEMPYGGIFNGAVSFFMDAVALLRKEAKAGEFAAVSNTLEEQALEIIRQRTPIGVV